MKPLAGNGELVTLFGTDPVLRRQVHPDHQATG